MVSNRWQYVIGLIIIVGMLVAAAFSLGVYVGEHGWLERGIQEGVNPGMMLPPQGNRPPDGQTQPNAPQPEREPDLFGRLEQVNDALMILETPEGTRQVLFNAETIFRKPGGEELTVDDLRQGDILAIFGRFNQEGGRELIAAVVYILPSR